MHQNVTSLAAAQQKNSLMFVGLKRISIIHPLTGGETQVLSSKTDLNELSLFGSLFVSADESRMGGCWGGSLLCMWDSGASFPLCTRKFKSEPR